MRNFRDDRRSSGRGFGGRDSRRSEMHQAICADCGRSCEVPFKPSGDKPVYCSECFKKGKDFGSDRQKGRGMGRPDRRDSRRFDTGDRKMYEAVCSECGEICEVPFRPSGDKPVFCDECFGISKGDDFRSKQTDKSAGQFKQLNEKLDKILKVLELISPKKQHIIEKSVAEAYMNSEKPGSDKKEESAEKPKKAAKKTSSKKPAKKKTAKK
jgi:CxxC-x17-CxxC domain-containing protein